MMTKKIQLVAVLIGMIGLWFAQPIHGQDIEVRLHESVLNTVIGAIAPISGKGEFSSPLWSGPYKWKLKNPTLTVRPDGLGLVADTDVDLNGLPYTTVTKGKATVKLNTKTKKLELQITQASFALQLTVFGNKIHLTDIDISGVVNQTFTLDVPTFNQTVQIPATDGRPTKNLQLETGTPSVGFAPPFLVVASPLVVKQ